MCLVGKLWWWCKGMLEKLGFNFSLYIYIYIYIYIYFMRLYIKCAIACSRISDVCESFYFSH